MVKANRESKREDQKVCWERERKKARQITRILGIGNGIVARLEIRHSSSHDLVDEEQIAGEDRGRGETVSLHNHIVPDTLKKWQLDKSFKVSVVPSLWQSVIALLVKQHKLIPDVPYVSFKRLKTWNLFSHFTYFLALILIETCLFRWA